MDEITSAIINLIKEISIGKNEKAPINRVVIITVSYTHLRAHETS